MDLYIIRLILEYSPDTIRTAIENVRLLQFGALLYVDDTLRMILDTYPDMSISDAIKMAIRQNNIDFVRKVYNTPFPLEINWEMFADDIPDITSGVEKILELSKCIPWRTLKFTPIEIPPRLRRDIQIIWRDGIEKAFRNENIELLRGYVKLYNPLMIYALLLASAFLPILAEDKLSDIQLYMLWYLVDNGVLPLIDLLNIKNDTVGRDIEPKKWVIRSIIHYDAINHWHKYANFGNLSLLLEMHGKILNDVVEHGDDLIIYLLADHLGIVDKCKSGRILNLLYKLYKLTLNPRIREIALELRFNNILFY